FSSLFVGSLSYTNIGILQDFSPIYVGLPHWLTYIATFLLVFIPFLLLFLGGLKILAHKKKIAGFNTLIVLIGLWILSLVPFMIYGIDLAHSSLVNLQKTDTSHYALSPRDTLVISPYRNDDFIVKLQRNEGDTVRISSKGNRFYPNTAELHLYPTDETLRLTKHLSLKGIGLDKSSNLRFAYQSSFKNDSLFVSNGLATILPQKNINRVSAKLELYIPQNRVFKIRHQLQGMVQDIPKNYFDHYLKFVQGQLQC